MKTYTIQFQMQTGNDEFWESEPSNKKVLKLIQSELGGYATPCDIDPDTFEIVRVVEE